MPPPTDPAPDAILSPPDMIIVPPTPALAAIPLGAQARAVVAWFEDIAEAAAPALDCTLAAEHAAAQAFQRMAKAENTRRAYRTAVRAWCAWYEARARPALPALGADVAAFLAAERHRGLTPNSIDLRRAVIRYLHRAAGCAVPTDDACVSETVAASAATRPAAASCPPESRRHRRHPAADSDTDPARPAGLTRPRPDPHRFCRRAPSI